MVRCALESKKRYVYVVYGQLSGYNSSYIGSTVIGIYSSKERAEQVEMPLVDTERTGGRLLIKREIVRMEVQ